MLHRAKLGKKFPALLDAAKSTDLPRRHVLDRNIGRGRSAPLRELLEDQRGIETAKRGAADIFLHVNTAEAERRRLAHAVDREDLVLIPAARMRHHLVARK